MAASMKIRAPMVDGSAHVVVLVMHPMETGQRKDDKGQSLPMHFIQTFTVNLNGKPIIDGQLNTSISKNPLFTFKARGIKSGDKLTVAWVDNSGDRRQDEITAT